MTKPSHIYESLQINCVNSVKSHHLQQSQVSGANVVEVDFDFGPVEERSVVERVALRLVVDEGGLVDVPRPVHAAAELPCEQVDAHDAEDEPEDEADE